MSDQILFCPACESEEYELLGKLGNREHFRCRHCGIDFSRKAPEKGWTPIRTVKLDPADAEAIFPNLPECTDPDCEDCGRMGEM